LVCAGLIAMAVLLGETRAIWIGAAVGGLYLVWFWRRWMTLLVPAAILVAFVVSPPAIRERFTSIFRPQQVDSNQFRMITWRTGLRMIEAHPWLGLGPEGPKYHFQEWVPPDVPRPLPAGWYGHLHNIYLQYAAERGIPTMLIMMWMLFQILFDFWKGLRALPPGHGDRRFLLHGGIAIVLATMAEGFFEYNLGDSEVLTMFLVVVACGYLALEKDVAPGVGPVPDLPSSL
jgi:O-antigen ligase